MPTWLTTIVTLSGPVVAAWAVWIAVSGKRFDARRAYAEFLLKQRIDASTRLMQACAGHMRALADLVGARDRLQAATDPQEMIDIRVRMERFHAAAFKSEQVLTDAMAAALPFFSDHLIWRVPSVRTRIVTPRPTSSAMGYLGGRGRRFIAVRTGPSMSARARATSIFSARASFATRVSTQSSRALTT